MNTVGDGDADLACVLIPTRGGDVLLPAPAVAEIVRGGECAVADGVPAWAQWVLRWRGREVPVVDLVALAGGEGDADAPVHIVLNRTRARDAAPFLALPALAAPRLVHVGAEDLTLSAEPAGPGIAALVGMGEMTAVIPDLARLQDMLADAGGEHD